MKSVSEGKLLDSLVRYDSLRKLRADADFCRRFRRWCQKQDIDVYDFDHIFKSCLVCKFMRASSKSLFQYALDLRFMKTTEVVCGPECQHSHGMVLEKGKQVVQRCVVARERKWQYYKSDGVVDGRELTFEDLAAGRTVCERTEPNRPAKFGIDADATWANICASCAGKPPPKNGFEFANYCLEIFQSVITTHLNIDRAFKAVVSYKSDYHPSMEFGENMSAKCSYHIIFDEFWMPDWRKYGSMIAELMLDADVERSSWLQSGVLDTSVYGNYKLFGCVLSGKFTDYEKQGANFRKMVLDPNFTDVSSYLLHCYDEKQPTCLDLPLIQAETVIPDRAGSCPEIARKRVSKRTARVYAKYKESSVKKSILESTTSAGYIKVISFASEHWMTDYVIMKSYVVMAKFERVPQKVAWQRVYDAARNFVPRDGHEQRRRQRVMDGRHFRIWWRKIWRPTPDEYVQASTKIQQFCNYELEDGALLKCMLNETLGISPRWKENTVTYRARYADQCINESSLRTKVHCFRFGMGQGKSSLMRKWIIQAAKSNKRVLILTSSLELCKAWKQELQSRGATQARYHEDYAERWQRADLCKLYITTFQSLYKTGNAVYDFVFIDEIVLVKEDATDSATNNNISANMYTFGIKMQVATKVFAADALLSSIELEWLEEFVPKKEITIHHNELKWGEMGTRTKKAIIYPRHNITEKRSQTPQSSMWYLSLKRHLQQNLDKLTHIHITPGKDMDRIMSTCSAHAAVDFLRPHLTNVVHIDDMILQFAELLEVEQKGRALYSVTDYKQSTQDIAECLNADAQRLQHSSSVYYSQIWTNTTVTAGVDWDVRCAYTSTWMCCTPFISGAQRMLQAVNRIRQTKNNCEQTLHLAVKQLGNMKPDLYQFPLGKHATFAACMTRSPDVIREISQNSCPILMRCWATNLYKRALWERFPQSCIAFLLRRNHWKVTYQDGKHASRTAQPRAKHRRPKRKMSTIRDVDDAWMRDFAQMNFTKKRRTVYDQTARTQKFLLEKTQAVTTKTTIHYALKQLKCCAADELSAIKNATLEEILEIWEPQGEARAILEREDEIQLRLKGDANTAPNWRRGLKILDACIKDNDKTATYHLWCTKRSAVNAIRWRRCGYSIDKAEDQLLQRDGIFGQWNDTFIPRFRLVEELEKHVLGDAEFKHFCAMLTLTKKQYNDAVNYLEQNESRYSQYFKAPKPVDVFRRVLDFYALKVTQFHNSRESTRSIDMGNLPTMRNTRLRKAYFIKLQKEYPALYQHVATECNSDTKKMLKWWKTHVAAGGSYSLVSKLSKEPNTRFYWRLNDKGM